MNTDTCTVYTDALCIGTLSVCCVTGTDDDTVTDIDIDTDTDTYIDTVDNDTEAARKLYFVNHVLYISCFDDVCTFLTTSERTVCNIKLRLKLPQYISRMDTLKTYISSK